MKTTLIFLKDFYSPLTNKWFIAADPKNNSIEIDTDEAGTPLHSFWYEQIRQDEDHSYFQLVTTTDKKPKKDK